MRKFTIVLFHKLLMSLVLVCLCLAALGNTARAEQSRASKDYVDAYFTSLAAASCLGQYLEDESMEFNYLRIMGWNIKPKVSRQGKLETHFSVAQRYFKALDRQVFLVTFRGSKTKMDWKINFKTKKINYGGHTLAEMQEYAKQKAQKNFPAVHYGFNEYTDIVLRESVVAEDGGLRGVFRYVQKTPKAHIILTGHSMGGAVATLLATRLVDLGFPKEKLHVLTFGAPAVGNREYNAVYADFLDIVRITNTNDPIPGSLQTFFGGYVQSGKNVKYHLSSQIGNFQHDMAMYFDHSIIDLYRIEDAEIAAGRMQPLPKKRIIPGVPLVALWAESSPGLAKMPLMPDLKRLLLSQYVKFIPSYVILNDNINAEKDYEKHDVISSSEKAGAAYVVVCSIDGRRQRQRDDDWVIVQEQGLFKSDGTMLSMNSFAKRVVPAVGNVQAAGENCLIAFADLQQHLPFIGKLIEDQIQ